MELVRITTTGIRSVRERTYRNDLYSFLSNLHIFVRIFYCIAEETDEHSPVLGNGHTDKDSAGYVDLLTSNTVLYTHTQRENTHTNLKHLGPSFLQERETKKG